MLRAIILLGTVLWATSAFGQDRVGPLQEPEDAAEKDSERPDLPLHRIHYANATFGRINPLGLIDTFQLGYRLRLTDSKHLLLYDTYLFVGPSVMLSPAFGRGGVRAEISPLAILKLFVDVSGTGFFGTFDQIMTWPTPVGPYDDRTIRERGDLGLKVGATGGWVATVGGTLQGKVGPVAARSTFQARRFDLALPGGTYFYDQFWDRLVADEEWALLADTDLLGLVGPATFGVRWTWSDTLIGDGSDGDLAHHRVGPLFAWRFKDEPVGTAFNRPTLFVLAQWWAQHPYRTGAEQPAGLPLIALGFAFEGDLWTSSGGR